MIDAHGAGGYSYDGNFMEPRMARATAAKTATKSKKSKPTPDAPNERALVPNESVPAPDETTVTPNEPDASAPAGKPRKDEYATAEQMARRQRSISVSEFFAKNRHLLGFDNPRKALLTTVKEAVDNALDACEEAGILPCVELVIEPLAETHYRVRVTDNGPGIVKKEIPNVFGKLLYGSKFHRLRMSRGQQGIGISAAGMYGQLTTSQPVKVTSKTSAKRPVHYYEIRMNTKTNQPDILNGNGEGEDIPSKMIADQGIEWVDVEHGTRVTIELEAKYNRGR